MSRLKLPLLSEVKARRLETVWRVEGVPLTISAPDPFSELLFFTADEGWRGMMNLREWFCQVAPEMAGCSTQIYDNHHLRQLFAATERPVDLPPKTLSYKKLRLEASPDRELFEKPLLCLQTPQGALWIHQLSEMEIPVPSSPEKLNISVLPIPLIFEIGVSHLSCRLLKKLAPGDILLISELTNRVSTLGTGIGRYEKNEGHIMIKKDDKEYDEYEDEEYEDDDDDDDNDDDDDDDDDDENEEEENGEQDQHNEEHKNKADAHHQKEQGNASSLCARVPITLSFILQKNRVTVEKLEKMYQGEVIPLEPSAEEKIEIRANNVPVARGKLLEMDDGQLGVELIQLYQNNT